MQTEPKEAGTMSHTPGPWTVARNVSRKGELGVVADAAPCVIAHGFSEKHWPDVAEANAHLIAAAPELLAALKDFRTCALDYSDPTHDCHDQDGCLTCKDYNASLTRVDAAIDYAEGRT